MHKMWDTRGVSLFSPTSENGAASPAKRQAETPCVFTFGGCRGVFPTHIRGQGGGHNRKARTGAKERKGNFCALHGEEKGSLTQNLGLIGEVRCTNAHTRKTEALNSQNTLHSQILGEEQAGSNTIQPSGTLLLFNGIFSHLQRHLHTKHHSPVNEAQHALLSSFTKLSVSSSPS